MIPLTAATTAARGGNAPLTVSLYAGAFTAVAALILVFGLSIPILGALLGLLVGAAPVLGVQMGSGALGSDSRAILAGALGFILFLALFFLPGEAAPWAAPVVALLSMILWPIIVGAMVASQSVGRLLGLSLLGLVLALVVFFIIAMLMGQDPTAWPGPASVFGLSAWGGTVGAAMASSRRTV